MEENYRRYPIGIQNFEELRNRQCVYVDKTELVYRLANTDKVYFFSRPRRLLFLKPPAPLRKESAHLYS